MSVKSICRNAGVTPHMLEVLESIGRGENPRDGARTVTQRRSLQLALTALWKTGNYRIKPRYIEDPEGRIPELTDAGAELLRKIAGTPLQLAKDALQVLLAEGEWHTVHYEDSHMLECLTCGASFANALPTSEDVKHRPGCRRAAVFETAKRLGLVKS